MIASAPWGPTIDLLIEMSPNASQPRVGTRNENGTRPTVSSRLHLFEQESQLGRSSIGPTPAGHSGTSNSAMGAANTSPRLVFGDSGVGGVAPSDLSTASKATISTRAAMTNATAEPVDLRDAVPVRGDAGGSSRDVNDCVGCSVTSARSSRPPCPPALGCVAPGTYSSTPQLGQVDSFVSPCQLQRRQTLAVIPPTGSGASRATRLAWFSSIGRN